MFEALGVTEGLSRSNVMKSIDEAYLCASDKALPEIGVSRNRGLLMRLPETLKSSNITGVLFMIAVGDGKHLQIRAWL